MVDTPFTQSGLTKLAEICKQARGKRSLTSFETLTGIPPSTLLRIEHATNKRIEYTTLQKLAPYTGYTAEELQAIGLGLEQMQQAREFQVAEEIMFLAQQLSKVERIRLIELILASLKSDLSD